MNVELKDLISQSSGGRFEVHLVDRSSLTCQSREDAELVLDADRRHYEGNTGRKLPRRTLAALTRAGLHARNAMLFRSAMPNLAKE
jgi:hypothetical protein